MHKLSALPGATGLYEPSYEHDACGIALVAKLWGGPSGSKTPTDAQYNVGTVLSIAYGGYQLNAGVRTGNADIAYVGTATGESCGWAIPSNREN